ncbi:hypothetical protein [Mesorhizobium sangaii]|nr:hypothetical protein [Mesorhizobium sangaii]
MIADPVRKAKSLILTDER